MNRFIKGALIGSLALAVALGTMGCQGGGTESASPEKSKDMGKKMGEGMKNISKQQQEKKAAAGAGGAGAAGDDEDKGKDKGKGGDKE